ncbi:hypothetical protein B0T25DRAFT_137489 [Lasiosphaeria hispida]|uniref:Secreted protein n=1 Tax=Lasiosphaeria hispida TaxID=260671 RepID=A0AAJ0HL80_9PEZI|nr:hypothetical protein B0T25DRAFT_137489 [Lasiosphaeria hispida]
MGCGILVFHTPLLDILLAGCTSDSVGGGAPPRGYRAHTPPRLASALWATPRWCCRSGKFWPTTPHNPSPPFSIALSCPTDSHPLDIPDASKSEESGVHQEFDGERQHRRT